MDISPRSYNYRRDTNSPFEPEVIRLQRAAEFFALKLEKERHLTQTLDDNIRIATQRLAERQISPRKFLPSPDEDQVSVLELQLDRAKHNLGELMVQNRVLRNSIDSVRRGNKDHLLTTRRLGEEFDSLKDHTETVRQRACRSVASTTNAHSKLIRLQAAQESTRSSQFMHMSTLRNRITEDKRVNRELMASLLKTQSGGEVTETTEVTSHLDEKWLAKLKSKRKELNSYLNYVTELKAGFHQMQKYSDIDELHSVVSAVLNSFERRQEVQLHLMNVSEQIDTITQEQGITSRLIQSETVSETNHMQNLLEIKDKLQRQCNDIEKKREKIAAKSAILEQELGLLQGPLREICRMGSELGVKLLFAEDMKPKTDVPISLAEEVLSRILSLVHKHSSAQDTTHLSPKEFSQSWVISQAPEPVGGSEDSEEPLSQAAFRARAQQSMHYAL